MVLMFIILGTFPVQGAIPRSNKKNPFEVFAREPDCGCVPGSNVFSLGIVCCLIRTQGCRNNNEDIYSTRTQ